MLEPLERRVPDAARDQAEDRQRGDHAGAGGGDSADDERPRRAGWQAVEDDVLQPLVEDRAEDDGDQQEEGESRRTVAIELEKPAGGDRDPGARDAGHQGDRLRGADAERGPEPDVLELPGLRTPVGNPENQAEDREVDRDLPRLSEMLLDRLLAGGAGNCRGDRSDEDEPGDFLVGRADRAPPD